MKNIFVLFLNVLFLFFSYSVLNADEPAKTQAIEINSVIRHIPKAGAAAMAGSVAVTNSKLDVDYEFKVFDRLPVGVSLSTEWTAIKNTTVVELPSHLTGLVTAVETTLPFFRFDQTYLRLKVCPSYYSDDWSFRSSAFRIPVQTFLIYQPDDQWTFIGGIAVYPDYENVLWPILGFIYKPNERLSFNLVPEQPNINYRLNDKLSLFAEAGFSAVEYEVGTGLCACPVLKYKESRIGTGAKYKFNKFSEGSVCVGGVFNRCFKYRDSLGKVVIKDGFYSEFRVRIWM